MSEVSLPRILIAAPKSGGGKTTVTCGLLRALIRRGMKPAAFKCGPDYIDPLFHSQVIGAQSGNLDLFFTSEDTARGLLAEGSRGCGVAVIEGVMGYYDGLGGASDTASAAHLARATASPVVLVVDAKGASLSLCATVKGFQSFRPDSNIRAVILNRCTAMQYAMLAPLLEKECSVRVAGYLPDDPRVALESRHLGLVTAQEVQGLREKLDTLADLMEETVDIPALLSLAAEAPPLTCSLPAPVPVTDRRPVVAVARDKAFCFYYRENLALLQQLGAELRFFSPLTDSALPAGTDALYLGGGYPELYGPELERNGTMREVIRRAVEEGMPTFAECGGFMYLHRSLTDADGKTYSMAGALDARCWWTGALRRFGYITLTSETDNLLCRGGESIPAHEFHYYDSDDCGGGCLAKKPLRSASWRCVHTSPTLFAGFPHLSFYGNPAFAARFVAAAERYKERTL